MSSKKRRVTVTLDGELVDLHKLKSPVPLSTDLNNYLQESLLCADELEEVNNQMERLQKKWNMLKSKQARLEQIKMMNVKNKNDVAACYDTLVHMEEANDGCIGKNQLHNLAEVKKLVSSYPNAFMLNNWISPPGHLAVTARATVGIATYFAEGDGVCAQNARYCAPNKIYEYAALGVPTLGNDIPGLRTTIGAARAGILCDMTEDAIVAAANELVNNIADYRARARQFYDGTNIEAQIKAVIARHRGQ